MRLKKTSPILLLIISASGCSSVKSNDFCLWSEPIYMESSEMQNLTEQTIDKILLINEMHDELC